MAFGAARHSRKKIKRLMYPAPLVAPWLDRPIKTGRGPGRGHKFGRMHFAIYRSETQPIGPGGMHLSKKAYTAKVCIGAPGRQKDSAARYLRSSFTAQTGDVVGCEWEGGSTPTKALGAALRALGRRLGKVKRGR